MIFVLFPRPIEVLIGNGVLEAIKTLQIYQWKQMKTDVFIQLSPYIEEASSILFMLNEDFRRTVRRWHAFILKG